MQRRQFLLAYSILTMFFISACGELDKVNGSLDQISAMSKNTDSMQSKMTQLPELNKNSCELYDALRQGDTLTSRRDAMVRISAAKQEAHKISEAAKYFMAFEFQLWSESCQDISLDKLNVLKDSAAMEFLREVQEFFPNGDLSPDPSAISDGDEKSANNLKASLNAMSAGLHMLNPKQGYRVSSEKDFKAYSMLDILEEGLAAKGEINSGRRSVDSYPPQVKEVLLQEKYAVAVLQARYNMAVAIVVDGVSSISGGFFNQAKMYLLPWNMELGNVNVAQLQEYQAYVNGALEVRDFLKKNGYQPEMNSKFKKVLKNLRYSANPLRSPLEQAEEAKLYKVLEQYVNEQ